MTCRQQAAVMTSFQGEGRTGTL